ncbi:MAG: hypothetical protein RL653_3225 [Pseudomonadota bacterium]
MRILPALCLASLSLGSAAFANRSGIGFSNCNNCHSGGTPPSSKQIFLPSLRVAPGETVPVEVRFNAVRGGFAMQASGGTLTNADGDSKVVGAALTHTDRKDPTNGLIRFAATWKAPSTPGVYTLEAWCNAVNGNGQQTGDKADIATTVVVVEEGGGGAQDAGSPGAPDAGVPAVDAGSPAPGGPDAGAAADAGTDNNANEPTGGCSAVGGSGLGLLGLLAFAAASRKRVSR